MIQQFEELEIGEGIKHALADMGFTQPTPIQAEVIPSILEGRDCLAQAPTGTGKTCAFGIPLIEMTDRESTEVQALVLCPTRELALQITEELHSLMKYTEGVRILTVYGGQPIQRQLTALKKRPQIIVGTPGRVIDHLNRHSIRLGGLKALVLDEADEMLNMGFREDIDEILKSAPTERQTTLFSATMSKEILSISREYQRDPVSVRTKCREQDLPQIAQYCVKVREADKLKVLMKIIDDNGYTLCLIFCNTKIRVQQLADSLNGYGYNAEALHGDLKQRERDGVMRNYRGGRISLLVATDVAARGIDVSGIEAVVNFDVPNDDEYYVHRIGRTARANREGAAYTLATARQLAQVEGFERFTKSKIERIAVPVGDRTVDEKKFALALGKLDEKLDVYRSYLYRKLEELNADGPRRYDFEDLAAALLAKLVEDDGGASSVQALSEDNSAKKVRRRSDTVKFFMNIGERDTDLANFQKFIRSRAGLEEEELVEVRLMDNYGFCEVLKGLEYKVAALDGEMFGNRRMVMEVAADGPGKRGAGRAAGSFSGRRRSGPYEKGSPDRTFSSGERKTEGSMKSAPRSKSPSQKRRSEAKDRYAGKKTDRN